MSLIDIVLATDDKHATNTKAAFAAGRQHTVQMVCRIFCLAFGVLALSAWSSDSQYTKAGEMRLPEHYRDWVYLSSGFDMSYTPAAGAGDHHVFDNVFVNPEAYKTFLENGTWPDRTMLILEIRKAESRGSINQAGNYQSGELMGVEVHVRDSSRFGGNWAFFSFDKGNTSKMIPRSASCYSCHAEHGTVDTTFVQFYPTLLPVARNKGTFSGAHQ